MLPAATKHNEIITTVSDILSDFNQICVFLYRFYLNLASGIRADTCRERDGWTEGRTYRRIDRQTDGRTTGHDENTRRFSRLCERAKKIDIFKNMKLLAC